MTELAGSDIAIGYDYFSKLREIVDLDAYKSSFLLTDNFIFELYSKKIRRIFERELENNRYMAIPAGEKSKTLPMVEEIGERMIESGLGKYSVLIALGGGVVSDLGGLAASLFSRGIDYINIPTTLVGQIDASIGGRCGVNLDTANNILGLFSPPRQVVIDPGFLDTLPKDRINDGVVELLKIASVADTDLLAGLESIRCDFINADDSIKIELIERAARLKLAVLARDIHQTGYSEILNFGHTAGDIINSYGDAEKFASHQAIAVGMLVAIELSEFICELNKSVKARLAVNIKRLLGNSFKLDIKGEELWLRIQHDRERDRGNVKFTLLTDIGSPQVKPVFKDQFLTAYNAVCGS
ncbi:MAG: 3-dehydroquinate synthase family protein [candidate division Zixibacteria bacterium]